MDSGIPNPPKGEEPAVDPFAPVTGAAPASKPNKDEVWEPHHPAANEPPEAKHIRHSKYGIAVQRWVYRNATGAPLFCTVRFEPKKEDGTPDKKQVLPYSYGRMVWTTPAGRRKDVTGWYFKRPAVPVPLYGLDRLAARPDARVLLCEGEKSACAAEMVFPDMVAIASQGGGNAPEIADWSAIAGRDVIVWPDADVAGAKFVGKAVELLQETGAASVRIVQIPLANWPTKWDLADAVPPGVELGKLRQLLDGATVPPVAADPGDEGEAEPLDGASAEDTAAEIDRLSRLSSGDYARERKPAAQGMRMGVGALDMAVNAEKAKRRREADAAARGRDAPKLGETQWPLGIIDGEDGLYADTGGEGGPVWLCDPLTVLGEGRDASGEAWSLYLKWWDLDGVAHTWAMPKRMLMVQPGELEAAFVDRGLNLEVEAGARGFLRQALNGVKSGSRVTLISQPGWHAPGNGESAFCLLNGETIGEVAETLVLKTQSENANQKMAVAGSIEKWQSDIAAKAAGNPVAVFAICAAFAGPLLGPMSESSGGFHFFGRSKTGKTLAMRMALSVWGAPKKSGLLRDWRSTANALEGAAAECNDGLLPLDEIHQADAKEVIGAIYQLANESGKQRLTRDAVSRAKRTWQTIVMSTGEIDVAAVAAKAGQKLPAGAEVRLPSIHLDGRNMWPELHGAGSSVELMAQLQTALHQQYGTPIRAFLDRLTAVRNDPENDLGTMVEAIRDRFYEQLPNGHDAQVRDVARRCALVAAAGELARSWNILPWKEGHAALCAETILDWWLNRRGGAGSTEESQHVKAVRAFLSEFGSSRFVALDWVIDTTNNKGHWDERNPDRPVQSRAGWKRSNSNGDQYLITPDAWQDLCSKAGVDPMETAKTLEAASFLATPGDGKNLTKPIKVPGMTKSRFYVVEPAIFADATTPSGTKQASE